MNDELAVLFVSHSSGLCGAERSLLDLIVGLKALNIKPLVLVPARGPLVQALEEERIEVVITPYRGWLTSNEIFLKCAYRALFNLGVAIHLVGKLKPLAIDLIYTNTVYSPLGGMLSKLLRIPHIWHAREFVHEDLGARYDLGTKLSMRFIHQTTDKVICNSSAVYHKMVGHIPSEKLVVVYNGLRGSDPHSYIGSGRDFAPMGEGIKLCVVGTLHEGKGHGDAIRALRVLEKHGLKAELRIVGTGDEKYIASLKILAAELGVAEQIRWEGFLSHTADVYLTSDITLICSKCEAFGRTAMEAMAVGCPVVGTRAGGLPEVITNELNGLLYPPSDYPALAAQILRLINDRKLYHSISRNAIVTISSRFTLDRYVSEINSIIRKVVIDG